MLQRLQTAESDCSGRLRILPHHAYHVGASSSLTGGIGRPVSESFLFDTKREGFLKLEYPMPVVLMRKLSQLILL